MNRNLTRAQTIHEAQRAVDRLGAVAGNRQHEQAQKDQFITEGRAALAVWLARNRRDR